MISFALAQELKNAGFTDRKTGDAEFFINERLKIRREDALRIWSSDREKEGWEFDPAKEMVYCPTLGELTEGCSLPFYLSSDAAGHWYAKNAPDGIDGASGYGESPDDATGRLWLALQATI